MMNMTIVRFPKWFACEHFNLYFDPTAEPERRFCVRIFSHNLSRVYDGFGSSVSWAAKAAEKLRQEKGGK